MKPTHYRWLIITLIFMITVINYIDRAAISYAIDPIRAHFHLSEQDAGLIMGAFGLGYLITTFFGGIWADQYGPRRVMSIAVIFWSLAISGMGLANGFLTLYIARTVLGLAEGPNFPAMTRAVGDWLPANERAKAFSYSLIAVPVALAVGAPFVSELINSIGWRGMFHLLALLGVIWLPIWWWCFRDSPSASSHVNRAELDLIHDGTTPSITDNQPKKSTLSILKTLLTNPTLLANNWAFFVFGYYLFFFMTWIPSYLLQEYHFDLRQVGWFLTLPWLLGALAMWLFGYLSDYLFIKTKNLRWARSHLIWLSQLFSAICLLPLILFHSQTISLISLSFAVAFILSANAAYYAVCVDIAKAHAGTALGIADACFAISGFLAPVITGMIIQYTNSYKAGFILMVALAISSIITVIAYHRPSLQSDTAE